MSIGRDVICALLILTLLMWMARVPGKLPTLWRSENARRVCKNNWNTVDNAQPPYGGTPLVLFSSGSFDGYWITQFVKNFRFDVLGSEHINMELGNCLLPT